MKRFKIFLVTLLLTALTVTGLYAQPNTGMSLSGATGLYSIPSGRIAWERSSASSAFGIDFGYHTIIAEGNANNIPKIALSFFNFIELSGAFDFRPEANRETDFIGGIKLQLPLERTALAFGGNYQSINLDSNRQRSAWQVYVATTYAGHFFAMPAQTTVVVGRTFFEGHSNSNIDFGMGFDILLLPNVFDNLIHWITDFANFSYSVAPFRADAWYRGVLNTGIRLNLSTIPAFSGFRFVADIMMVDAFDHNRAFSAGLTFGVPIL